MKRNLFTKNFTLLILGQTLSLFGNYILKFALSMYVLEQTGSAVIFASLMATATVPTILFSPFGGILADRINRRNIMVTLDALSGAVVLSVSLFWGLGNEITLVGFLLIALSIMGAFESPTVQACVPQMLKEENIIRGNAIVNQITAVSSLISPFLGSVLYTILGLRVVLYFCTICFFATAGLECLIRLSYKKPEKTQKIFQIVREDFSESLRFLRKDHPEVLALLLLTASFSFFTIGAVVVGLPFLIRNVLGLSAEHYGIMESSMGVAAIVGTLLVNILIPKLKIRKLYQFPLLMGVCFFPVGVAFLFPLGEYSRYLILLAVFFFGQLVAAVFSVFSLSLIQKRTPEQMTGKIMSYVSTITLCAQPLGQMVYGVLYDWFAGCVWALLIPTGIAICLIAFLSKKLFRKIESQETEQNAKKPAQNELIPKS